MLAGVKVYLVTGMAWLWLVGALKELAVLSDLIKLVGKFDPTYEVVLTKLSTSWPPDSQAPV